FGPLGSLIQSGPTLYGMTAQGGSDNYGTIFQIGTDGEDYSLLHIFSGAPSDGALPNGSLTQSGSKFYGMTFGGGSRGFGTIFQIGTDGMGFSLLHSFTGAPNDGDSPRGSLIQSGSTLYGMTASGGGNSGGTIFKIGTDGSGFSLLHSFAFNSSDAAVPY